MQSPKPQSPRSGRFCLEGVQYLGDSYCCLVFLSQLQETYLLVAPLAPI